ncbi:ABC transporter substrate-binding protein [Paenibacillus allorhizosphaerae]|uniref:ABC transporter substrate-binding protein YesO n=1 Tax=Paenibacillus allorhizosphaerae TaxID=2849866 RepID=A0ABM8VF39_9BACL|nr:extracellular solute-binding protein [Paenibacillus allorhizosphaerae]CAG7633564.1 Putative ABC transporter substrate-binding protein YesO [Paenibacillus allorhizosphaerae]
MNRIKGQMILSTVMIAALLAGCSTGKTPQSSEAAAPPKVSSDPVTLTLFQQFSEPDIVMNKHIMEAVKKKFPHVTLEIIKSGKGTTAEELLSAGQFPDIIYSSNPSISNVYVKLGLVYELTALIKKYNVDLGKFNPLLLDAIKLQAPNGELYALPHYDNSMYLTYYNKDIFDKFGVPYPKDGMVWEEYLDLQRKLTRVADGVQYQGMDPQTFRYGHPGYSNFAAGTNDKPDLLNDKWVEHFRLAASFYKVPGAEWKQGKKSWTDQFFKDRTTAIFAYRDYISNFQDLEKNGTPMNWDIVSYPSFKDSPGIGIGTDSHNLSISATSKHKEEAFQVIAFLVSKEAQSELVKDGKLSPLTDQDLKDNFGKNLDILKGKNVQAIFKTKPTAPEKVNPFSTLVSNEVNTMFKEFEKGNDDVVTLLRQANEAAAKSIEAEKKK